MDAKESLIRHYISNTSFHGYKFIAEEGRHWTERVFWSICCTLSLLATGFLINSTLDDFYNNSISFVVETSYLEWDTQFPSVAVCEIDNQKKIARVTDRMYGDPHDYNLDEVVKELVFFRGLSFYTLQICGPEAPFGNDNCDKKNFTDFAAEVRGECDEIFKSCQWNGRKFDCCRFFQIVDTEMGICYVINSIQTRVRNPSKLTMINNVQTGPGTITLQLYGYANVYILGEQEVPALTTLTTDVLQISPGIHYHRFFTIKEIDNQPEVKEVNFKSRKCRFDDESQFDVYPFYSYSACCVQCRKDAQLRTCGCAHHLMPNTPLENQCRIDGLYCLNKHNNNLTVLKAYWSNRSGLVCDCLPSCTEIELSVVKDDKSGINGDYALVELSLVRLPSERFKRNVVRGKLDLVGNTRIEGHGVVWDCVLRHTNFLSVSMGGSTALFLGASLLSFVEIFYYFVVKPASNRINNKCGNHDRFKVDVKRRIKVT